MLESGDTSKPYRYIPMFAPDVATRVPSGLSIEGVNDNRLADPRARAAPDQSAALGASRGLLAHRFSASTIRAEERLYIDSWGLKASTTDAQFLVDVHERVRIWPHLRFNAQSARWISGSSPMWRGPPSRAQASRCPALRTGDRELGPLLRDHRRRRRPLRPRREAAPGPSRCRATCSTIASSTTCICIDRLGFFGATTLEADFE